MPLTGGSKQSHTLRSTNASIWLQGWRPTAAKRWLPLLPLEPVHREHEGSEGTALGNAERAIFVLLFLLLPFEDSSWGGVAIQWGVRVGDTDVEDCSGAPDPNSVDGNVSTEFWGGLGAVGAGHLHVLTCLDKGFV
jgi:hypothetical protein